MSYTKKDKIEWITTNTDEGCIILDGCDNAIVGIAERNGLSPTLVYDYDKLVNVFIDQGMDYDEAIDWIETNVLNIVAGDTTPIILTRCPW